jgi:phage shock protein A
MENDKELIFRFSKIVRDNFNSSEEIMVEAQKVINDIRQDTLRQVLPDIMETPSAYP